MRLIALLMVAMSLSGCASAVEGTTCTSLISGAGGMLQFCQTSQRIEVSESGLVEKNSEAKIVDDPSTLAALADHLKLNANLRRSRKLIAHACVVHGATYVSVKASDLERILRDKTSAGPSIRSF